MVLYLEVSFDSFESKYFYIKGENQVFINMGYSFSSFKPMRAVCMRPTHRSRDSELGVEMVDLMAQDRHGPRLRVCTELPRIIGFLVSGIRASHQTK